MQKFSLRHILYNNKEKGNVGSIIQPGWAKGSVLDALDGGTRIDHGTGQQKSGLIYQLSLSETECPLKTRFGKTK